MDYADVRAEVTMWLADRDRYPPESLMYMRWVANGFAPGKDANKPGYVLARNLYEHAPAQFLKQWQEAELAFERECRAEIRGECPECAKRNAEASLPPDPGTEKASGLARALLREWAK